MAPRATIYIDHKNITTASRCRLILAEVGGLLRRHLCWKHLKTNPTRQKSIEYSIHHENIWTHSQKFIRKHLKTNPEKIWLWWFFHGTPDLCCFFLRKDISRGKRRPKVPVDCGNMRCFWTLAAILIVRTQAHLCTSFASFNWSSVAEVSSTKMAQSDPIVYNTQFAQLWALSLMHINAIAAY